MLCGGRSSARVARGDRCEQRLLAEYANAIFVVAFSRRDVVGRGHNQSLFGQPLPTAILDTRSARGLAVVRRLEAHHEHPPQPAAIFGKCAREVDEAFLAAYRGRVSNRPAYDRCF
jgi:hypothetical protein